ncbi:DegV family protein with EDD domain [Mycoplasmoides fastidiosum]|uniref:DegV family protein with EDD domain n=1 Tax=Mycoplasmoides fastidiosum TaxID=92758 RepID=A0ABU0LZL0_9BACT|nr:DegV family protein [Mycoplasmoides fastidiosum]MDQ0514147.1 DegV family protein with EDD domain [Mycoplasmoides fastidiosum]UUD37445.1 DegV family EDD domain-containing protein [Mycoplasmoides fastidiosum]
MQKLAFIVDDSIVSSDKPLPRHHYAVSLTITEEGIDPIEYNAKNPISFQDLKTKISLKQNFKTNAIVIGQAFHLVNELLKDYEKIVICGISSGLSSSYDSWKQILRDFSEFRNKVLLVNNQIIGEALYEHTKRALIAVQEDDSWAIIKKTLEPVLKFNGLLLIQDLSSLHRGGRISTFKAKVSNLLQMKILIQYKNGKLSFYDKETSLVKSFQKMHNYVEKTLGINLNKPNKLILWNSFIDEANFQKVKTELNRHFPNTTFVVTEVPKPILVHVGIDALAITKFYK